MIGEIRIPVTIDLVVRISTKHDEERVEITGVPITKPVIERIDKVPPIFMPKYTVHDFMADDKPIFKCDFPGCGFLSKSRAGTNIHKAIHDRKSGKAKKIYEQQHQWGSGKPKEVEFKKGIMILDCPNPRCFRKKKFVKNTGYFVDGVEWCSARCHDEYKPVVPKEVL